MFRLTADKTVYFVGKNGFLCKWIKLSSEKLLSFVFARLFREELNHRTLAPFFPCCISSKYLQNRLFKKRRKSEKSLNYASTSNIREVL